MNEDQFTAQKAPSSSSLGPLLIEKSPITRSCRTGSNAELGKSAAWMVVHPSAADESKARR
jgi:hypothetical protein